MERVFLIGGYDLEMKEIVRILNENNENYIDKKLQWGAKLSDYKDEISRFNGSKKIYALELEKDIEINENIILLDHHNENSNENSTLEQVVKLLGITLTREQKLISENDKGYIPALEKFGASKKEIEEIRRADRKSQGVTDEDERQAEKSIVENKIEKFDIIIVKSLTGKFSPICDRLYPVNKLIIYTDNELNYYGEFSKKLYKKYQTSYKVYTGGGDNGYFGFERGDLGTNEIKNIIKEIIEYVRSN